MQSKIHFKLVSDYTSILHGFDANYRVVTILAKLLRIAREILEIKKACIQKLQSIKVGAYQDDTKA